MKIGNITLGNKWNKMSVNWSTKAEIKINKAKYKAK